MTGEVKSGRFTRGSRSSIDYELTAPYCTALHCVGNELNRYNMNHSLGDGNVKIHVNTNVNVNINVNINVVD